MSVCVCSLFVCPSVDMSKRHDVTCGRGSVLSWRQCNTLCTSGLWMMSFFQIMGQIEIQAIGELFTAICRKGEVCCRRPPCVANVTLRLLLQNVERTHFCGHNNADDRNMFFTLRGCVKLGNLLIVFTWRSVATWFRCAGTFDHYLIANLRLSLFCKNFWNPSAFGKHMRLVRCGIVLLKDEEQHQATINTLH